MNTLHNLHSIDILPGQTGVTVRLGKKWLHNASLDSAIDLCICTKDPESHEVVGKGVILDAWFGIFIDIPGRLLELEHEASSRTYSGLLASMKRAYGNAFDERLGVTVLTYMRIAEE
jgi:hypothetical protein